MRPGKPNAINTEALIAAAVRGEFGQAQAVRLCQKNPEIVASALLAAARRIAEQNASLKELQSQVRGGQGPSPAAPSAVVPVYAKRNAPKTPQTPGGQEGAARHSPGQADAD